MFVNLNSYVALGKFSMDELNAQNTVFTIKERWQWRQSENG